MLPTDIQFPPYQGHCVKVSVINGAKSLMSAQMLVTPTRASQRYLELAGYSFFIESAQNDKKVLFDLAFMKDLQTKSPPSLKPMLSNKDIMRIEELRNVPSVLEEHNVSLSTITSIVWSHAHIDHTGDPSTFPPSTELVVGPGLKTKYMPGYPKNTDSPVLDSAFQGRHVRELDFSTGSTCIGGFQAIDFFHNGSFWLLHTPGHTDHHLSALCRTTEDSWVFLGGDVCHSIAQLRPSQFRPLPAAVPAEKPGMTPPLENCSCAHLTNLLQQDAGGAFYGLAPEMQEDLEEATKTIEKLRAFDGRDDVLVVLAHDATLLDVMRVFPGDMNDWKEQDWANRARWLFLRDFKGTKSVGRD
jgi:glyoxylase-like metal-dependent hydrolase (beta-lactamase superfamily II)